MELAPGGRVGPLPVPALSQGDLAAITLSSAFHLLAPHSHREPSLYLTPQQVSKLASPQHQQALELAGPAWPAGLPVELSYHKGRGIAVPTAVALRLRRLLEVGDAARWEAEKAGEPALPANHRGLMQALCGSRITEDLFRACSQLAELAKNARQLTLQQYASQVHAAVTGAADAPSAAALFVVKHARAVVEPMADMLACGGHRTLRSAFGGDNAAMAAAFAQLEDVLNALTRWRSADTEAEAEGCCRTCRSQRQLELLLRETMGAWCDATKQPRFVSRLRGAKPSVEPGCCCAAQSVLPAVHLSPTGVDITDEMQDVHRATQRSAPAGGATAHCNHATAAAGSSSGHTPEHDGELRSPLLDPFACSPEEELLEREWSPEYSGPASPERTPHQHLGELSNQDAADRPHVSAPPHLKPALRKRKRCPTDARRQLVFHPSATLVEFDTEAAMEQRKGGSTQGVNVDFESVSSIHGHQFKYTTLAGACPKCEGNGSWRARICVRCSCCMRCFRRSRAAGHMHGIACEPDKRAKEPVQPLLGDVWVPMAEGDSAKPPLPVPRTPLTMEQLLRKCIDRGIWACFKKEKPGPNIKGVLALLHVAHSYGYHKLDYNYRRQAGETALHAAAFLDDDDAALELLAAGASPESRDSHGNTPQALAEFRKSHRVCAAIKGFSARQALDSPEWRQQQHREQVGNEAHLQQQPLQKKPKVSEHAQAEH